MNDIKDARAGASPIGANLRGSPPQMGEWSCDELSLCCWDPEPATEQGVEMGALAMSRTQQTL